MTRDELIELINRKNSRCTFFQLMEAESEENGPFDLSLMWSEKIYQITLEIIELKHKLRRS